MAFESYLMCNFASQGKSPGQSPRKAHLEKIPVLRIEHEVIAPRDVSTGKAMGKRSHKPLKVLLEVGKATAYFYNAATQNELLKQVDIEFWDKDDSGVDRHCHHIKLSDAHVVSVRTFTGEKGAAGDSSSAATVKNPGEFDTHHLVEVAFAFRRIDFEDKVGGTVHADDWLTEKAVV